MAMPEYPFAMTDNFLAGHHVKLQDDEVPAGASIFGSKNFVLDDDGKWRTRPGSAYLGRISSYSTACTGGTTIRRRDGVQIPVVMSGTYSLYLHPDYNDWTALEYDLSDGSQWGFAPSDVNSGKMNLLAMGSQNDLYRLWSGATALVDSWTANTITIQGVPWCVGRGFTDSGNLSVNGVYFAYSGTSTTSFTGVTPDPTGTAIAKDQGIAQKPVTYVAPAPQGYILVSAEGTTGGKTGGRVLVMGTKNATTLLQDGGQVWGSKINDPTYWTIPGSHIAGDPFVVNIPQGGGAVTGSCAYEDGFLVWKDSYICKLSFSTDNNDYVSTLPFINYDEHSGGDEGSASPFAIFRLGTSVYFVSPTAVVNTVQRVANVDYPRVLPLSDPIKRYIETLTIDAKVNGCGWRGRAYFFFPTDGVILVYDTRYECWYAPYEGLSIVASFVKDGKLYGALKQSPNIIQLWTGTTDLSTPTDPGLPINSELDLGRMNFGSKDTRKEFDRFYLEGIMTPGGTVEFDLQYDEAGAMRSFTLKGTDTGVFFSTPDGSGLGTEELGTEPLGDTGTTGIVDVEGAIKFRLKLTTKIIPFYNLQLRVKTSTYFKLLSFGPNVRRSRFRDKREMFKALS